jgi:hypothetical protein
MSTTATLQPARVASIIEANARCQFGINDNPQVLMAASNCLSGVPPITGCE